MVQQLQKAFPRSSIEIMSISLGNYQKLINEGIEKSKSDGATDNLDCVFLNLCDGIETDGYPGVSIVNYLESKKVPFTGAGSTFYINSTSKTLLKNLMLNASVPTLPFVVVNPASLESDLELADKVVGYPLIIKPSVSYGSMMISTKSVVDSSDAAASYINGLTDYKDEIFLEAFLAGREFTVLCSGDEKSGVRVYTPAERVFSPTLTEREKILTFDICWDGCDLQENTTGEVPVQPYWYEAAPKEWQTYLEDMARNAYISVGGTGYGRVDIRTRKQDTKDGFVLEVNANCGLAFGRMASSLGEILILSNVEPNEFCREIVSYAFKRYN